jgi:regulatory Fis family protein
VVLASGDRIDTGDRPEELGLASHAAFVSGDMRSLEDVEREYILAVLRAHEGNRANGAEHLHRNRDALPQPEGLRRRSPQEAHGAQKVIMSQSNMKRPESDHHATVGKSFAGFAKRKP